MCEHKNKNAIGLESMLLIDIPIVDIWSSCLDGPENNGKKSNLQINNIVSMDGELGVCPIFKSPTSP